MSLTALAVLAAMGGYLLATIPANWHVMTRHSDVPEQVVIGVEGLEAETERFYREIDFRAEELEAAATRCRQKAADARAGLVESGETADAARRERLMNEEAPRWDRAAEAAAQALLRVRAR